MTETPSLQNTSGLDRETKQAIRNWVLKLRHLFQDDITKQLRRYGIEVGTSISEAAPDYLSADEKRARQVIVAAIKRDAANELNGKDALNAYIRECAYTLLNRLVGLKCMEARGILFVDGEPNEVITTHSEYANRSRLLWMMREESSKYRSDEALLWREGLMRSFQAVTDDIAVLFDIESEWSQVWPSHAKLMEAIKAINGLDGECRRDGLISVYASPDFLGWVYQFFNIDEKDEIREATKGKPRTSHELAVINQFYTPDWIVKFLVDNTLGRVWLRMHPDTGLRANISYLVPKTGEDEPAPLKPVRELKLLDPACGTMHMGQYAYGLLYEMYLEELKRAGTDGWPSEPSLTDPTEIPAAILANNLHGIDIDPRAIQIAALTLLLTMKEQAQAHGLDPKTVRVRRMNLVCANAVNLGDAEREEFLNSLDPAVFGGTEPLRRAVQAVWKGLQQVAELGSLVQVGEEVERALQSPIQFRVRTSEPGQMEFNDDGQWGRTQLVLTEEERATAREQLETALADYARKLIGVGDMSQRLFAQETGKAISLLDLLRQKYDVVVMNPPYGDFIPSVIEYIQRQYPKTAINIYATFIFRGNQLLERNGLLGALVSRTFLTQPQFEQFRREVLLAKRSVTTLLDLGSGVLDGATVETAAFILSEERFEDSTGITSKFFRLEKETMREAAFVAALNNFSDDNLNSNILFSTLAADFLLLPQARFMYRLPKSMKKLFQLKETFEPAIGESRTGLSTSDDDRFVRFFWEIFPSTIGNPNNTWKLFAKGGDYCRYYSDISLVVRWDNNGKLMKDFIKTVYGSVSRSIRSESYYFREGITYPNSSSIGFSARYMPPETIISVKGQGVYFDNNNANLWWSLGFLNTSLVSVLLDSIHPGKDYQPGDIKSIPIITPPASSREIMAYVGRAAYQKKFSWDTGNEISTCFTLPWLAQATKRSPNWKTLADLLKECRDYEKADSAECQRLQVEIDSTIYALYEISQEDRAFIACELGARPAETVWPQMASKSDEQKRVEHVCRLLSYLVKISVEEDEDGIIPLVPCVSEPTLAERVRRRMETLFGVERCHAIEGEINNLLPGRTTLDTWLAKSYFKYHVGLYKRRPIFWHITSEDGSFGAIVHYHRFTFDRLLKLRNAYLYDFIQRLQSEIGRLRGDESREARERTAKAEESLESARALDAKLQQIQEGEIAIEVPWKSATEQPKGWRPDIDDGVKVNIAPFEKAGVLSVKKVV